MSTEDRERWLATWKKYMDPVVMVAAILPIVVALTERGKSGPAVWLDVTSWLVFIADYAVRVWLRPGYWRSKLGAFDLFIVLLTAPWYIVPRFDGTRVLGLARLGRLGRMFVVSAKGSAMRELGQRLGTAAVYSLVLMLCAALVVRSVEPPSSGFETFGDAMWWAMVTFTTVGYGDLFPVTTAGRIVAVALMLGGVALIGALAGSLGSFFTASDEADGVDESAGTDATAAGSPDGAVLEELRAVRAELAELRRLVADDSR